MAQCSDEVLSAPLTGRSPCWMWEFRPIPSKPQCYSLSSFCCVPYSHHSFLPHNLRKEDLWDQDVGSVKTCSLLLAWGQESSQWLFHIRQGHQSWQSIKNIHFLGMFIVWVIFRNPWPWLTDDPCGASYMGTYLGPVMQLSELRRCLHLVYCPTVAVLKVFNNLWTRDPPFWFALGPTNGSSHLPHRVRDTCVCASLGQENILVFSRVRRREMSSVRT